MDQGDHTLGPHLLRSDSDELQGGTCTFHHYPSFHSICHDFPRLSVLIVVDSNIIESPERARSLLDFCKSLEVFHASDLVSSQSSTRAILRFKFVFASPVQDCNDLFSLNTLGYFAKLHKPIKRSGMINLMKKILTCDEQPETWQPRLFVPRANSNSLFASGRRASALPEIIRPLSGGGGGPGLLVTPERKKSLDSARPPILIVDDNTVNQQVFSRMLRSDYSCDIACDGDEAIKLVDQKSPRGYVCVLMDFHMAGLDGITATRRIRERGDEKGKVPIIGLSADSLTETKEQAFEAGMNMYLTKPVKKDVLLQAIQEVQCNQSKPYHHVLVEIEK